MRRLPIALCVLLMACGSNEEPAIEDVPPPLTPAPPKEWKLVWSDEFGYTGKPDPNKWGYDIGGSGWGNNESQFYTDSEKNARVEDGRLIIEAHRETIGTRNYTSARLVSRTKGDWTYAKVEARAKLPVGRGNWAAIWMLPTDWLYGAWPRSGEIDIMEHVGFDEGRVHGTVHTDAFNHTKNTQQGKSMMVNDATSAYHIYSAEWLSSEIVFKIDGITYFTFRNTGGIAYWPFDQRFHLLLNIAIGGSWGGLRGIDDSVFPQRMEVDYVRVYQ
jgi:beta-glucanase (GH16 family)